MTDVKYYEDGYEIWYKTSEYPDWIANKLQDMKHDFPYIDFFIKKIIWKKPTQAKGYIQFTIRPYVQGYGCDGTTDDNIHYLGMIWCSRRGLDYSEPYRTVYGNEPNYNHTEILTWFENIRESIVPIETYVPPIIITELLIEDLEAINNRQLASIIEVTDTLQFPLQYFGERER